MIVEKKSLFNDLFQGLIDYNKYIKKYSLDTLLNIKLNPYTRAEKKITNPDVYYAVNPNIKKAFPAELDDLCRLHYLIISRKVTTIMEFGVGKSTLIFNNALIKNKIKNKNYISQNLRRGNLFECHSVDNNREWLKKIRLNNNLANVHLVYSGVSIGTFNDRICTFYKKLPDICPDFIYLDGPDQFSAKNSVRGICANTIDRVPMSGDVLALEPFLYPGTLLVVDGRTANARFLKNNLQRDWIYCYNKDADQHFFELSEDPLGIHNNKQINFCLGKKYFHRLKETKRVIKKSLYQTVLKY